MIELQTPITEEQIRALRTGDVIKLNGLVVTARDAAHKLMIENFVQPVEKKLPDLYARLRPLLDGGVIYHCGPVVAQNPDGSYRFVAAGPTTSIREEPYEADVIGHFHVRAVIGKGGMGAKTLAACKEQWGGLSSRCGWRCDLNRSHGGRGEGCISEGRAWRAGSLLGHPKSRAGTWS